MPSTEQKAKPIPFNGDMVRAVQYAARAVEQWDSALTRTHLQQVKARRVEASAH